jgi:hypothetical protein
MSEPFCDAFWHACGYRHACLKRKGHDGPCWCCGPTDDPDRDFYPGGDLSLLEPMDTEPA